MPRTDHEPPEPAWKRLEGVKDKLPPRGPGHFCAQMPQEMGQADLVERVSIDVAVRPRRNARATHADSHGGRRHASLVW